MRRWVLGWVVAIMIGSITAVGAQSRPAQAVERAANLSPLGLRPIGTYRTDVFDAGAAEIVAHDPASQRLFVVNGDSADPRIDILSVADPRALAKVGALDISAYGESANSVAVRNGVVAVAVQVVAGGDRQQQGKVVFFTTAGQFLSAVTVGALPDMLTWTPDGSRVVVANEGEPNDSYSFDPEGAISVITIPAGGVAALAQSDVATLRFSAFNVGGARRDEFDPRIRVYGPGASVAQDLEPEYVAVSDDSRTAWVTLQENNALAIVDLQAPAIEQLVYLGEKDYSAAGNGLDASDDDGAITIASWPVRGLYMPDGIDTFTVGGQTYLITANEGDSRAYTGYDEEARIGDLTLDATAFPNAAALQADTALGRLKVTAASGNTDAEPAYEQLYTFGTRSFSIWNALGELVYDSGDDLEQITAAAYPGEFNATNDENGSFDNRSDDKGPEPETVTVATIDGRVYAFVGLERIGGVVVFDVTTPTAPTFVRYTNPRDFGGDAAAGTAGDLGPEGVLVIPASDSPTGRPLLAVANEISGSTTIYEIGDALTYLPLIGR